MGLDYNGVGNHEFDEGIYELLRVAYGDQTVPGYTPARPTVAIRSTAAATSTRFHGADFPFLAANVVYRTSGETIFAPYAIHEFTGGVRSPSSA